MLVLLLQCFFDTLISRKNIISIAGFNTIWA